jgi:hypothetical protein
MPKAVSLEEYILCSPFLLPIKKWNPTTACHIFLNASPAIAHTLLGLYFHIPKMCIYFWNLAHIITRRTVSRMISPCKDKKVKFSLCLTNQALLHEGVWGSGCIDPYFLDLGTSWRWVVSFAPWPLYPRGKRPRYPLERRLGGPQSRFERRGEEKNLHPTRTRTPTPRSSIP